MLGLSVIEVIGLFISSTKHENKENMNELTDKNVFDIILNFNRNNPFIKNNISCFY